jgi:hypothetical protein
MGCYQYTSLHSCYILQASADQKSSHYIMLHVQKAHLSVVAQYFYTVISFIAGEAVGPIGNQKNTPFEETNPTLMHEFSN